MAAEFGEEGLALTLALLSEWFMIEETGLQIWVTKQGNVANLGNEASDSWYYIYVLEWFLNYLILEITKPIYLRLIGFTVCHLI